MIRIFKLSVQQVNTALIQIERKFDSFSSEMAEKDSKIEALEAKIEELEKEIEGENSNG